MNEIIACGVPRTGSTLVWQILVRALPSREITKAHPASWTPKDGCFIVGSIRHPYDIAASCFRGRIAGDDGDGSPETVKGTKEGLVAELKMMTSNFEALKNLMRLYPNVVLRYEDFFNNFGVIFNMIEKRFDVALSPKLRRFIKEDCSFEANQRRSCTVNKGKDYQRTKINNAHVGIGTPGTWKTIIPIWGYGLIKKWCDPLCKEWGYAD